MKLRALVALLALAAGTAQADTIQTKTGRTVEEVSEKRPVAPPKRSPRRRKLSPAQVRALHQRAMGYFRKKDYDRAIAEYGKILGSDPENMIALYNTACAYSLMKDRPNAVGYLKKSLEAGYVNFAHMQKDADLDNIRAEPGYKTLISKKAEYVRKSTDKVVGRITKAMAGRGVDVKRYRSVLDGTRNFVYLHRRTDAELVVIRKGLEEYAGHQWKHLFANKPTRPLYIVLLTPGDSRKVLRRRAGGVYSSASNTLFCGDIPTFRLMKTSIVVHEFTHALHFADMLARGQRHPIWLVEGLATLFEASDRDGRVVPHHSYRLGVVQAAVQAERHIPWKALMKMSHPDYMRTQRLAYAQSRYVLFYLHDKGLLKTFYDDYTAPANFKRDRSALESFEVALGKPIECIERDWREWVMKQKVPPVPFLGIEMAEKGGKVAVTRVVRGTPAAKGGIRAGDAIDGIDGDPIKSISNLMDAIGNRKVGDEIAVEVMRGDKKLTLKVKLGRRRVSFQPPRASRETPYMGLTVEQKGGNVYAREVASGSPADKAGIKPGMALLEFQKRRLASVRDYLGALKGARPGQSVRIKASQADKVTVVTAKLIRQPG